MAKTIKQPTAKPEPVFPNARFRSHMPFFDGERLLFSYSENPVQRHVPNEGTIWQTMADNPRMREHFADLPRYSHITYRAWRLFHCPWDNRKPMRLDTGLPEGTVECSPAMYEDSKGVYVSFIGGVPTSRGPAYRLYLMEGRTLESLSPAKPVEVHGTWVGFVSASYICIGRRGGVTLIERSNNKHINFDVSLERLLRVSYRADEPTTLLITGMDNQHNIVSITHDISAKKSTATNTTKKIQSTSLAYKPSIYGNEMISAEKGEGKVEPYELVVQPYELAKSQQNVSIAKESKTT